MLNTLLVLLMALSASQYMLAVTAMIPVETPQPPRLHLWLTISARQNLVEVWWQNAPALPGDQIIVTHLAKTVRQQVAIPINAINGSHKTNLQFNFMALRNFTAHSRCYDYWTRYMTASYIVVGTACLRAYPTWMHDLHPLVGELRMRDLFLPGTHDSGAYRSGLSHPRATYGFMEKVAVTQDEDIWTQLIHGVRYLDIRVGFNPNLKDYFHIYHGHVRFASLSDVINQVKRFVLETHEVVIFGLKEFPVGFGGSYSHLIHKLLVYYLQNAFKDVLVNPALTWNATLRDIWDSKQYVILAYENAEMLNTFPNVLFSPVNQRWGNVNTEVNLEAYLRAINIWDVQHLMETPAVDMAELTPSFVDAMMGRNPREMADEVNLLVSKLYRDELGANANIVAVDFFRGSSIVDIALDWNLRKVASFSWQHN